MNKEVKKCQNCQQDFVIEPEDFLFYQKIQVPAPTFCPECRMVRRMQFRNLKTLYKRKVEGVEKEVFAMFHPDSPLRIVDEKVFRAGEIDTMAYGRDYDFNKPFFQQFKELMLDVPFAKSWIFNCVNSDYCNNVAELKNCYLCFNSGSSENILYGIDVSISKDSIDLDKVQNSELCYELYDSGRCNKVFFSSECGDCHDIYFSHNLVDCHDCFGCVNLTHKSYHIFNKPYSKKNYFEKLKELDFGSYQNVLKFKKELREFLLKFPVKFMHGHSNVNVSGDYLEHCKNVNQSFMSANLENCSYCQLILFLPSKDSYDTAIAGGELCYEVGEGVGYGLKFCWYNTAKRMDIKSGLRDMQYTITSFDSAYLFGCVGLNKKQYCILNKQYAKKEYEKLVPRIKEQMNSIPYVDKKGRVYKYGEFFPAELSPFSYNETIAQEYFPLTKEQAADKGYLWKDPETKNYQITMTNHQIPDHIKDVNDSITKEIIECEHRGTCNESCATAFKIIPQELQFYKRMKLPLPRLCPNCRHYQRIKQRNPLKLWHRKCMCGGATSENGIYQNTAEHNHHEKKHCPNEFETTYSPDRQAMVYCEKCYQQEVI